MSSFLFATTTVTINTKHFEKSMIYFGCTIWLKLSDGGLTKFGGQDHFIQTGLQQSLTWLNMADQRLLFTEQTLHLVYSCHICITMNSDTLIAVSITSE